jgi:hypothetical protein
LAARARDRWNAVAGVPCRADTSGVARGAWGRERWAATIAGGRWSLLDSLDGLPGGARLVFVARVACPR